jgi:hypothetical protein
MSPKREFPKSVFVVQDNDGKLYLCETLQGIPVYYNDHDGIIVAEYVLHDTAKVTKELKYEVQK